jgi:hypothetical protein
MFHNIVNDAAQAAVNLPPRLPRVNMICADVVSCFDRVITDPSHPDSIQQVFAQGFHLLRIEQPDLCFFASFARSEFSVCLSTHVPPHMPSCIPFNLFLDLFTFMLKNSYLHIANQYFIGTCGHPQGLPTGPWPSTPYS